MLGGVLADFVKGPVVSTLPADVQEGIRLHRCIDGFTDRHPIVHRCIGVVSERFSWFSGIVIDIYYDHILARDWDRYSTESLVAFATRAYRTLESAMLQTTPEEGRQFLRRFIDDNRLLQYATLPGIADTLARVSDRIARRIPTMPVRLETAMDLLQQHDTQLSADFHTFYPELIAFAARCKAGE